MGQKRPNAFGLYDMLGNVWERVADYYIDGPATSELRVDPTGPPQGKTRILRSGAWYRPGDVFARSAARGGWDPHFSDAGQGFRVAIIGDLQSKLLSPAIAPFTDADVQRIAALPAAEQVEEVRKELMKRNPGFDGTFEYKIQDDVGTEFRVVPA